MFERKQVGASIQSLSGLTVPVRAVAKQTGREDAATNREQRRAYDTSPCASTGAPELASMPKRLDQTWFGSR